MRQLLCFSQKDQAAALAFCFSVSSLHKQKLQKQKKIKQREDNSLDCRSEQIFAKKSVALNTIWNFFVKWVFRGLWL